MQDEEVVAVTEVPHFLFVLLLLQLLLPHPEVLTIVQMCYDLR